MYINSLEFNSEKPENLYIYNTVDHIKVLGVRGQQDANIH